MTSSKMDTRADIWMDIKKATTVVPLLLNQCTRQPIYADLSHGVPCSLCRKNYPLKAMYGHYQTIARGKCTEFVPSTSLWATLARRGAVWWNSVPRKRSFQELWSRRCKYFYCQSCLEASAYIKCPVCPDSYVMRTWGGCGTCNFPGCQRESCMVEDQVLCIDCLNNDTYCCEHLKLMSCPMCDNKQRVHKIAAETAGIRHVPLDCVPIHCSEHSIRCRDCLHPVCCSDCLSAADFRVWKDIESQKMCVCLSCKAAAEKATADKATAEQATADKATAEQATADKATAEQATADKATTDEKTMAVEKTTSKPCSQTKQHAAKDLALASYLQQRRLCYPASRSSRPSRPPHLSCSSH